jgi:hypothetical protein
MFTFPKMKKTILFIIVIFVFSCCQTTQYASPESFKGKEIIISEGGGVSGQTTQHIVLDNGQVFVRTIYPASLKELNKLKKKTVEGIFDRVGKLKINETDFQHPGNMTYSLSFKSGKDLQEIKWGDPAFPVPASILECYQFIREQINLNNKP